MMSSDEKKRSVHSIEFGGKLTPWRQNSKVHHRIHNSPPTVHILSQVNPLHTPQPISLRSILTPSSHLRLGLSSSSSGESAVNFWRRWKKTWPEIYVRIGRYKVRICWQKFSDKPAVARHHCIPGNSGGGCVICQDTIFGGVTGITCGNFLSSRCRSGQCTAESRRVDVGKFATVAGSGMKRSCVCRMRG
jgi:hypothetical protein